MSRLVPNTTPCERERGCTWADNFQSQALVEANQGTVVGAPTFNVKTGVTLDGAADYLTYDLAGTEFDSDPISFVFVFTPDFDWDEDAYIYLLDADDGASGSRSFIQKADNAGGNNIAVYLGASTFIANIPSATYSPFWLAGQRNVLVISSTSTDTDVWLNGNAILVSDPTAWAPQTNVDVLHVGSNWAGGSQFDGTIHSLRVIKAKLTEGESTGYYSQDIYSYRNEATIHLPMRMSEHDIANTRTLDISGNAGHMTLVSAPPKLVAHGYELDGALDYLTGAISTDVFNNDPLSIVVEFTPAFNWDENANRYLFDTTGTDRYQLYKRDNASANTLLLRLGNTLIGEVPSAAYSPFWLQGQRNVLVVSGTTGDTDIYLNGTQVMTNDASAWATAAPVGLHVCSSNTGGNGFDGDIHSFQVYHRKITQMQVWDIWVDTGKKVNDI